MTDERFAFRIPRRVADKHIKAKRRAEANQDYKPITWTEWFDSDPRLTADSSLRVHVVLPDKEKTK